MSEHLEQLLRGQERMAGELRELHDDVIEIKTEIKHVNKESADHGERIRKLEATKNKVIGYLIACAAAGVGLGGSFKVVGMLFGG